MEKTLEELGTPWAQIYRGSHRLTGRLAEEPVYCQNGEVAPDWIWVGSLTEQAFWAEHEAQEHDQCHTSPERHWHCPQCQAVLEAAEDLAAKRGGFRELKNAIATL